MQNKSSLVNLYGLSPYHSGKRTHSIDRITPHCFVGQVSADRIAREFQKAGKNASCNYGIASDGRVVLVVDESYRSWCSSSNANDQRAVTIECASDNKAPYAFNNVVFNKLIELCVDICKRNNKNRLLWINDKKTALSYVPKDNEMLLTVHRWFANKACPGEWLMQRMALLADEVTKRLNNYEDVKMYHTVKKGDTLYAICKMYSITMKTLLSLNPGIVNPNLIIPGQEVRVR